MKLSGRGRSGGGGSSGGSGRVQRHGRATKKRWVIQRCCSAGRDRPRCSRSWILLRRDERSGWMLLLPAADVLLLLLLCWFDFFFAAVAAVAMTTVGDVTLVRMVRMVRMVDVKVDGRMRRLVVGAAEEVGPESDWDGSITIVLWLLLMLLTSVRMDFWG